MKSTSNKSLKNVLTFIILVVLTTANYIVIRYIILRSIFAWCSVEENISWKCILLVGAALSIVALIAEIVANHRGLMGVGRRIIEACCKITLMATLIFGGFVLLETIFNDVADVNSKTMRWLSLAISLGIFNYLDERRRQREIERDENMLVVVAECPDMSSAQAICTTLEANDIKAMMVEKHSPIYIKGGDTPVQVQVRRKDLNTAKSLIAK